MARLVLINGAPGSGKSTLAAGLAHDHPLALALDVDLLKHSLGQWNAHQRESGLSARRLASALARAHLSDGHDVIVGQYLARTDFAEDLEGVAAEVGVPFFEFILELSPSALAHRLAGRSAAPTRPEHFVNNTLVGPRDADRLVASLEGLREARPRAVWIDASGSAAITLEMLRALLR